MNRHIGFAFLLWAAGGSSALASPLELFGFQARGRAMGGALTAAADDHTAVFYNPSMLGFQRRTVTSISVSQTVPALSIQRSRSAEESGVDNGESRNYGGVSFGGATPLGKHLAVGFAFYNPFGHLIRGEAIDAQRPQFYRYQNLPDKFMSMAALALRITDWLSIGYGVQLLADLDGRVGINTSLLSKQTYERSTRLSLPIKLGNIAGLAVRPMKGLTIGASWRQSLNLEIRLPTRLTIDDSLVLDVETKGSAMYTPGVFNLGLAYEASNIRTLFTLDGTLVRWSKAPDPSLRMKLDISGSLAEGLGLADRLDIADGSPVELGFRDTVVLRAGVEHRLENHWSIRGGYGWRPTPAPLPTGAYNYIDSDAHILSTGVGAPITRFGPEQKRVLSVDVAYHVTLMMQERVTQRSGANDPVGDFTAGGPVHAIGLTLRQTL
jgi:long-subunit fatty acid transport protein